MLSAQQSKPFVLGEILTLNSTALNEQRTLNIYLPAGYNDDDTTRYPVIYLLDGSADEDFIHVAGLVQFCNFSWINILPPSIVVGIANVDRKRDFTFPTSIEQDKKDFPTTGGSAKFIEFLGKELQPLINKQYRTSPKRSIIGQSLGGLLATEVLFKQPQLFDDYIIISPSLWWDKESLLAQFPKSFPQKTKVHVSVGNEGKVMERDAKNLYKKLKAAGVTTGYNCLGKEDHASIMHKALSEAFKWF
ncbi:MAG: alpha/beta hydrolase-fold protein [Saprospiraceae bacterium]|nr:alpha/beta hydrolase-fold protein [Saprospiraceae bacterium]